MMSTSNRRFTSDGIGWDSDSRDDQGRCTFRLANGGRALYTEDVIERTQSR